MAEKTQRSFDKEYLDKRAQTMQQFLDSVLESEILRSSLHVLSFLKCEDDTQWGQIKEQLEKAIKKTSNLRENFSKKLFEGKNGLHVEDFDNVYGEIQCRITGNLKDYAIELDEVIKVSEPLYQKLIDATRQLGQDFAAVSTTMSKIAEISTELYNTHRKFNTSVKSHKWERMQDMYAAINQSMVIWEKSLRRQFDNTTTYLLKSFKYTAMEFDSFNDVHYFNHLGREATKHCRARIFQVLG